MDANRMYDHPTGIYDRVLLIASRIGRKILSSDISVAALLVVMLLILISASACAASPLSTAGQPTSTPGSLPDTGKLGSGGGMVTRDKSPAVLAAKNALAQKLGISPDQIQLISAESVQWPDGCLGAAKEGEMCAQVITPGDKIILSALGRSYEVHTDEMGKAVRIVD